MILAAGITGGLQVDTAEEKFGIVGEFKRLLKKAASKLPKHGTHLQRYPANLDDLPREIFDDAYANGNELPVGQAGTLPVNKVQEAAGGIALRRTSRSVRDSCGRSGAGPPLATAAFQTNPGMSIMSTLQLMQMMTNNNGAANMTTNNNGAANMLPGLQIFQPGQQQPLLAAPQLPQQQLQPPLPGLLA